MNETQNECTGYDLALGSIHGVRTWKVDSLGRLRGVHYDAVWKPGENVATCRVSESGWSTWSVPITFRYSIGTASVDPAPNVDPDPEPAPEPTPHTSVDPSCTCGFYAYHDGVADYGQSEHGAQITGVIECYGRTTVGTRGVRCERAKVVGLVVPRRFWIKPSYLRLPAASLALVGLFVAACIRWPGEYAPPGVVPIAFSALVLGVLGLIASAVVFVQDHDDAFSRRKVTASQLARLRRNYPDVRFFHSQYAATRAFPLERAVDPTPETDPTFWERTR